MLITDILENTESLQVIVSDIKTFYETIDENNTKIVYLQKVNYTESKSINEINSIELYFAILFSKVFINDTT